METIGRKNTTRVQKQFKSYYVVWKHTCSDRLLALPESLNRTMQYGNQLIGTGHDIMHITFKSYYVVWKPLLFPLLLLLLLSLNRTMQYGNIIPASSSSFSRICLNRTMQYGNLCTANPHWKHLKRLNRTMQYGNSERRPSLRLYTCRFKSYYVVWKRPQTRGLLLFSKCLNRTMQYGNCSIACKDNYSLLEFKSYYVVWKLFSVF